MNAAGFPAPSHNKKGKSRVGLRLPLLVISMLILLSALWAGMLRLGWAWPVIQPTLAGSHGPLMVSGFFGTLISLERAVALQRRWPYVGPVLSGLGGLLLLAGLRGPVPPLLLTAGSLGLVAIFVAILRRHTAGYTIVMAVGSLAWFAGNLLWLAGQPIFMLVLWWAAFLVLTIAGERLELGRLIRLPPAVERLFFIAVALFIGGLVLSLADASPGVRLASLGMLSLAVWLARYDISRRTIRQPGLPRFAAVCLLSGYFWLGAGGILGLVYGAVPGGVIYDAFLHTIFVGFVFSMIFGHAPIIFPAILGLPITFKPFFYLPLWLLHASLGLRLAGDLLLLRPARLWGGLLNGVAILLYLGLIARSVLLSNFARPAGTPVPGSSPDTRPNFHPSIHKHELAVLAGKYRRYWRAALACFLLAAGTGSLMRFWMVSGFPAGLSFPNIRHAHSHLMYFAWVTPALMALIAARLPVFTKRPNPPGMGGAITAALVFGLISYPSFFVWGYEPVAFGEVRLPVSVIFSSLNILTWYAFIFLYRKAVRASAPARPLGRPVKLWNAALIFLFLPSLGAWARGVFVGMKIDDPFLTTAAVHLFLDLFSSGWALLGLLGLIYASRPALAKSVSGWEDPLLFAGLPLSFLLGLPVSLVPPDLRTLSGIGGLMVAAGLALHVRALWREAAGSIRLIWAIPLGMLALTAGMQAGASLAPLAVWGEQMGLRVLYLHVLLLGFATLGLMAAGVEMWERHLERIYRWMAWSVLLLLGTLLPLTGLWPDSVSGDWRLMVAALASTGPVVVGLVMLVQDVVFERRGAGSQKVGKERPAVSS